VSAGFFGPSTGENLLLGAAVSEGHSPSALEPGSSFGGVLLVDVKELRGRLREGLALLSRNGKGPIGDYLEFGVFQGTSMICMWEALKEMDLSQVRLFGFDSFEGLPDIASTDDGGHWKPGEFAAPYDLTKERLAEKGIPEYRAVLIKGWFSDTLNNETKSSVKDLIFRAIWLGDVRALIATRKVSGFG
jgi:hypothetical protein